METVLGKYELRSRIASGPMSTIYEGWDTVIKRTVAIKAVPLAQAVGEGAQNLARFRREAQAAGRLQHPNIVAIYDYGETNDFAYIVMEYVAGRSLKNAIETNTRFTTDAIALLMGDILSALQYTHAKHVVHRDIKPANIMLDNDGRAKIADFGIAHLRDSDLTQIGTIMGTPAYMSPEQFRGEPTSASTDIYSAGIILYQLLTGERPFDGGMATIMHKALNTDPPPPSAISGNVPRLVDDVVSKAIAKRPDQRFSTAAAFLDALLAALAANPVPAEPKQPARMPPPNRPPPTRAQPAPRAAAAAAAALRQVPPPRRQQKLYFLAGAVIPIIVLAGGLVAYRITLSSSPRADAAPSPLADPPSASQANLTIAPPPATIQPAPPVPPMPDPRPAFASEPAPPAATALLAPALTTTPLPPPDVTTAPDAPSIVPVVVPLPPAKLPPPPRPAIAAKPPNNARPSHNVPATARPAETGSDEQQTLDAELRAKMHAVAIPDPPRPDLPRPDIRATANYTGSPITPAPAKEIDPPPSTPSSFGTFVVQPDGTRRFVPAGTIN